MQARPAELLRADRAGCRVDIMKKPIEDGPAWAGANHGGARSLAASAALVSAVFFGVNAVAPKLLYASEAATGFDAVGLFVARGVWSLPLFVLLAVATRPRQFPALTIKNAALFLFCGIAYGPGTNALSALGAHVTSASHAVLLLSLFPPLAAGLAAVFLRERLSTLKMIAIVVGVMGASTLTLSRSSGGATTGGDLLIAAFILTWAILTLGIRQLDKIYPALFVVGVFGTIGCLALGAIGAVAGRFDSVLIPMQHFDLQTVLWFDLELVLLLSLGGQLLQSMALRALDVAMVVALTSYGSIFFGLVASLVILGERLAVQDIIAAAFLVTALGLSLWPERRRRKDSNPARPRRSRSTVDCK
ncbi:DMT family transporter [Bradyrhizobium lablabi]|uniref:DMT family transporter n=1 Tax=Bradyrhizobium lablabi TaxID=722472 RepID=UPI001BA590C4|nr:DMT family transporter [Bradyrhizobium lablabi]MBR1124836.1 DMT family transporter [Bradyrhizobium lablabi]